MKAAHKDPLVLVALFSALNIGMYVLLGRFWIGGSSFLPLVGKVGPEGTFLLALLVNVGVIIGAGVGAASGGEFRLRGPDVSRLPQAIGGGFLIGTGITLAPGTCTTAFVTGVPMLSVSSFLSIAGIFLGGYIAYRATWNPSHVRRPASRPASTGTIS